MGRLAGDVASVLPSSGVTGTVALVGATGVAVGVGVLTVQPDDATADTAADITNTLQDGAVGAALSLHEDASADEVSRSSARPVLVKDQRADKSSAMTASRQQMAGAVTKTVEATDPRDIAMTMLSAHGWSSDQFSCLDELYMHESGWDPLASNPSSGAHGIPQALPGDKMAEYGSDWATNPETQLAWGLAYIQDRYGSPCGAWDFWLSNNWY